MSQDIQAIKKWLFDEFAQHLATVFEAMAGQRPDVDWSPAQQLPDNADLRWSQELPPLPGRLMVAVADTDGLAAGEHILKAAGVEDGSEEELRSTFTETIGQAVSSLARSLTERLLKEINGANGQVTTEDGGESHWGALSVGLGDSPVTLCIGVETTLLEAVAGENQPSAAEGEPANAAEPAETAAEPVPQTQALAAAAAGSPGAPALDSGSKTFDLLLDVEMPVSVSFGKAQVALKEVLKLTTGSIVELDRGIAEPVDVVVNNCVIARGEVVVVEGNFGVRIQQVMSRNERLRSLE